MTALPKVIGVGNPWRSDDAAGLAVARRLRAMPGLDVDVAELEGDLTSLIDAWEGGEHVIVIDAVCSGAEPGTVHRLDAHARSLPRDLDRHSTHAVGLATAIEVGRALDRLPQRLIVFGIEGQRFDVGAGAHSLRRERDSPDVTAVMDEFRSSCPDPAAHP